MQLNPVEADGDRLLIRKPGTDSRALPRRSRCPTCPCWKSGPLRWNQGCFGRRSQEARPDWPPTFCLPCARLAAETGRGRRWAEGGGCARHWLPSAVSGGPAPAALSMKFLPFAVGRTTAAAGSGLGGRPRAGGALCWREGPRPGALQRRGGVGPGWRLQPAVEGCAGGRGTPGSLERAARSASPSLWREPAPGAWITSGRRNGPTSASGCCSWLEAWSTVGVPSRGGALPSPGGARLDLCIARAVSRQSRPPPPRPGQGF